MRYFVLPIPPTSALGVIAVALAATCAGAASAQSCTTHFDTPAAELCTAPGGLVTESIGTFESQSVEFYDMQGGFAQRLRREDICTPFTAGVCGNDALLIVQSEGNLLMFRRDTIEPADGPCVCHSQRSPDFGAPGAGALRVCPAEQCPDD